MTTRDLRIPLGLIVALAALGSLAIVPSGLSGPERILAFGLPVVAGLTLTTIRPTNRHELFFHRYWLAALASWWLAALMSAVADGPCLWSDGFRLLGHAAVVLAVATSPHRADGRTVGPVRQVQFTAVLLVLVALAIYGPGLAEGDLAAPFHAVVDLVFFAVSGWLVTRATTDPWRWTYLHLAVGFCLFGIAGLAIGHVEPVTDIATAMALVSFAGVPRRSGATAVDAADRGPVEPQKLPFEIPVFVAAMVLPGWHLGSLLVGGDTIASEDPAVVGARGALALATLLALGGLAFVEHALLRRRATHLEVARDRAADEEAERSIYLTSLIEHSPLAIVVLDPDHIVQLCNPAFEKLFDYKSDDVVGTGLDRLIAPGEQAIEARGYTRQVLQGATVHDTTYRLRRDGTPIDVEIHGVPLLKDGELVGIFALYQDVTERILSEQALRESEERFRRLSDATFEGIVVSEEGRIVDCNEQYAQLVGLPRDEVLGRRVLDFVDPVDHAMVLERLGHDDDDLAYEHRALRADRSARIVEVHARNIPWNGRHVRVAAVRDVTEQRRFEEEVRQSQKMEAVGRLAGGIAHDFNNLLTVIKGYAQLLFLQMAGDKRSDLVDEIVQATDRASLMTQRLLAFGRKQPFQPQTLDLADAVRSMEKILRRLIRADIQLVFDLVDGDGRARVDPGQFEQVILNLAINAADAMPSGGTLTLTTDMAEVTEDEIHQGPLTAPGSYVRLRVRDTGTGMDDATRKQVFEPFFTTKSQGKGTGLGLATVYAIVHQSGGAIEVRSAPGEGSEFTIVWPRVLAGPTEPAMAVREPAQRSDLPAGSETVLVVEDEPGVRLLAREFLELQGYRVHVAEDGSDGLERFETLAGEIDLVLTDVVMPGMNGPEMIQRLRADRPELRVLYMSGYTDEILGEAGSAAATLVHKPFSVEELVTKVREILDSDASSS